MRITVDRERCCSSGQCVATSAELFDQDPEDGIVVLRIAEPPPELQELAEYAAAICPTRAILIER